MRDPCRHNNNTKNSGLASSARVCLCLHSEYTYIYNFSIRKNGKLMNADEKFIISNKLQHIFYAKFHEEHDGIVIFPIFAVVSEKNAKNAKICLFSRFSPRNATFWKKIFTYS